MDARTRGRQRARWATGGLAALSLMGTVGVGAAVAGGAPGQTSSGTLTTNPSTPLGSNSPKVATPNVATGSGQVHARTHGS